MVYVMVVPEVAVVVMVMAVVVMATQRDGAW